MTEQPAKEWVLPASIPFADLKRKDLEECVYWLLDAMGAKDLEWRTGGTGGGAADGGRDLEARFYAPSADGEMESRKWWVECKGRAGTVEPDEVKSAIVNAMAMEGLDYIVIATNTQFSNPTRDWIKEWQGKNPRPKVKLWDHTQLERYLSRHPDVVLRLFSEALSLEGRFNAMSTRFWNKIEFVTPKTLADLWKAKDEIGADALGIFAAIANEFANGSISNRPWGAILDAKSLVDVLEIGLINVSYLVIRSSQGGIDQKPTIRALTYLILRSLEIMSPEEVVQTVTASLYRGQGDEMPEEVKEVLLMPIVDQLLSEMQDVCGSDCWRIMILDRKTLTEDKDEVADYWLRFEPGGVEEQTERKVMRIEKLDAACMVGFPVDKDNSCPLFGFEPNVTNAAELLAIIKRVASFRKGQAIQNRQTKK